MCSKDLTGRSYEKDIFLGQNTINSLKLLRTKSLQFENFV